MTTLKERFEAKFSTFVANESDDILSFFRQEMLALADEVEKSPARSVFEVAALIRSKADELK